MIKSYLKVEGVEVASLNPFVREIRDLGKNILKPYMLGRVVELVRRDQRSHIDQQRQVGGAPLMPKRSGKMRLVDTGLLYRSITGETTGKGGRVFIRGIRANIGGKLQERFNWWGVDDKTETSVMEYLMKEIKFDG